MGIYVLKTGLAKTMFKFTGVYVFYPKFDDRTPLTGPFQPARS